MFFKQQLKKNEDGRLFFLKQRKKARVSDGWWAFLSSCASVCRTRVRPVPVQPVCVRLVSVRASGSRHSRAVPLCMWVSVVCCSAAKENKIRNQSTTGISATGSVAQLQLPPHDSSPRPQQMSRPNLRPRRTTLSRANHKTVIEHFFVTADKEKQCGAWEER